MEIVICLLVIVAIVLFFVVNYIKGTKTIEANGKNIRKAYETHPEYEKLKSKISSKYVNDSYINSVFELGVQMFMVSSQIETVVSNKHTFDGGVAFTEDIAIISDSTGLKQQWGFPCGVQLKNYISIGTGMSSSVVQKQRSVVGSAVVGAVVAGEVGAVVGAVSAASANKKGDLKIVASPSGSYYLYFDNKLGEFGTHFIVNDIFVSKKWVEKYHLEKYVTTIHDDIYCISGCSSTTKEYLNNIVNAYNSIVDSLTK